MRELRSLRHLLAGILAIATMMLVVAGSATTAEALYNCAVADTTFDQEEQAFLTLINRYRETKGLQPLTVSVNLNQSASWMARDLADKNYFSHTDSAGRDPFHRIQDCGATMNSGENLAAGGRIDNAIAAFNLWRSSYGHNQNMLFAPYTQIGIARAYNPNSRYKWYWATTFSVPDDGTRMPVGLGQVSPVPSTELANKTATVQWTDGVGFDGHKLDIGTSQDGSDVYSASLGQATRVTVPNLPWQTPGVSARLGTRVDGEWQFIDDADNGIGTA